MPITAGLTPATAEPAKVPSGSIPSAFARSALAITSAAAPSLIPLALPAVTEPAGRNGVFRVASFSTVVPGRGCSSWTSSPTGTSSSANRPASCAACPPRLRARREGILILAGDVELLGDVLAGLPHRGARVPLLIARVDEPPAERRVVERAVAARVRRVRLRSDQRRAGHRLDPAGDEEVTVAGDDRLAGTDNGREPRGAQPVDRHAGDRLRQPRQQRGEAGDVAVVLTGLIRAAEPHVLDLARGNAGPLDRGGDRDRGEVVGANLGEAHPRTGRRASGLPTG